MPDGPWRAGDSLHIVVEAGPSGARAWAAARELAAQIDQPGSRVSRLSVAGTSSGDADQPPPWTSSFPAQAATDTRTALQEAVRAGADCLIMDGALDLDREALGEMRRVLGSDPMIAGVSPRIVRVISSAVRPGMEASGSGDILSALLPAVTYVPLPEPRCLYLKGSVLAQFGEGGSIDWDALALFINRYGFRMAVANRALARAKAGSEPVGAELLGRGARLERAYPGTRAAIGAFLSAAPRRAEQLLAGLAPNAAGRREVGFDLTHLGQGHSGTAELARSLIRRAAESWTGDWEVHVVASRSTYDFHFADAPVQPLRVEPGDPKTFAAFVRIGQPFAWKEVDHAVGRAPVLVCFMLDTIGLDCIRMAPDELDALWRFVLAEADGVLFNSSFTERQFERRFGLRHDLPRRASLHSVRLDDYRGASPSEPPGDAILVLGNAFPHKYVEEAASLLASAYPDQPVVALGPGPGTLKNLTSHSSGSLGRDAISDLYRKARVVVYPSLYEGFGFPLLEALAYRRPVLARALAPFAEILQELPEAANVHVFETDAELVRLAGTDLRWIEPRAEGTARGWSDALADLREVLEQATAGASYDRVLRRLEFMQGRMDWMRRKPFRMAELAAGERAGDDAERLAGLAGRIAQNAVLSLARVPGAAGLLRFAGKARGREAGR